MNRINKDGPIVVIEDDEDDQFLISSVFKTLAYDNEIVFFSESKTALEYLNRYDIVPFIVFSDINMPRVGGLELRDMVQADKELSNKCYPYIFLTTANDNVTVTKAFAQSVQGFFVKPMNYHQLLDTLRTILAYWHSCHSPELY